MRSAKYVVLYPKIYREKYFFVFAKGALALIGFAINNAWALDVELPIDNALFSVDSTVSYGELWRVQGQDKFNDNINRNDGNRNFNTGVVSEVYKLTSDFSFRYRNYGAFMRGVAFYDSKIMNHDTHYADNNSPAQPSQSTNSSKFTPRTRDVSGSSADILDAYVFGNWTIGNHAVSARLGRQVINWGEGVFYRTINATNPVDLGRLQLPGAEVKEALIPLPALDMKMDITDHLSAEGYYQWGWKETALSPVGSYFSDADIFVPGSNTAYGNNTALSTPAFLSLYRALSGAGVAGLTPTQYLDSRGNFKTATIGSDINARNNGQFGLAFRYTAEAFNSTEFGFYYANYHAKEPTISTEMSGENLDLNALTRVVTGGAFATYSSLASAAARVPALRTALSAVRGVAVVDAGNHTIARREYSEDIRLYGFSFNTPLGNASIFGDLAYRPNLPIARAATNDLVIDGFAQIDKILSGQAVNVGGAKFSLSDTLHNNERVEAYNYSLGTIYNFGPLLGFDGLAGSMEVAGESLRGSSLRYTAYDGAVRYFASRANLEYGAGYGREYQVDRNAFGATFLISGTWNDVIAGVNLSPYVVYKNDFSGNSYSGGQFIDGRTAYTLGLKASYKSTFEGELQYTTYSGAGQANYLRDRDNIGLTAKYSF